LPGINHRARHKRGDGRSEIGVVNEEEPHSTTWFAISADELVTATKKERS
jgi:hypothetical protein